MAPYLRTDFDFLDQRLKIVAGGWDEKTLRPEHRFLRTGQGGFFSGVITPTATGASLELRLHDVDGRVVYRELKWAYTELVKVGTNDQFGAIFVTNWATTAESRRVL